MMTQTGKYTPMDQRILPEGSRLMLRWHQGWTFHTILGTQRFKVRPFIRGVNTLAGLGTQTFFELQDDTNRRLFAVTETYASNIMYHVGIGMKPTEVRFYYKYPSGIDLRPVLNWDPVAQGNGFNGERGYVTGQDSPYNRPTDATEFFFPHTMDLTVATYNVDRARAQQPVFSIEGAQYYFETLNPADPGDQAIIARMASGQIPRRLFTLGPPSRPKEYTLKSFWGVDPVDLRSARKGVI